MFEVGVSENVKNLEKVKEQLNSLVENYSKNKAIQLKVEIENLDAINTALSKIGDSPKLRELRQEIESLNREFSKLAAGAGGVGDLNLRAANQNVAELKENWQSANRTLLRYKTDLEDLRRSRDMQPVGSQARADYQGQIATFKKTVEEQQKIADAAKSAYDKAVKDAGQLVDANTRAEASYRELKSSIDGLKSSNGNVVGTDFANWAKEVQSVTASVRELVEQLQKITTSDGLKIIGTSAQSAATAVKATTEEYKKQEEVIAGLQRQLEFYQRARERAEKTITEITTLYPNGFNQPWKDPSVHAAIQQDKELQEKTVASLDSKWDAFWKKQETQAVQFAQMLGKSLDGVTFEDFYKHANGQFQALAKSWYANFHAQGYDRTFLFDADHEMKLLERLKELRKLKSEYKDTATFQSVRPEAAAELQLLESLKRKVDEYNTARTKAFDATPNQSVAMDKLYADQNKVAEAQTIVTAAKEKEAYYTKQLAQEQQKLNELQSKGTTTQTSQGTLFDSQQFNSLREAIDQVIKEINRLKEAFSGIGEIKGMTQLTESINALFHNVSTFKDVFSTLSAAVNLTPTSEYVKKLQQDFEAVQAKVLELTEKLTALSAAQNNVAESASKAGKSEKQIGDSQAAMFNRYNKLLADIQNIKREIVDIQRGSGGGGPFGDNLGEYFSALNKIRNSVREITSAPSVADAIQRGMSSEMFAKLTSAVASLKTRYKEVIADAKNFNKATDKGSSQAESRIRKLGMAFNDLKGYIKANGGSEEMKRLQSEIQGAIQKMRQLMNAGNFAGAVNVYERMASSLRQAATATKEYERSVMGAASANSLLTSSEHQLANALKNSSDNMRGQSQVLSDLKMLATQYLSVWGAQSFINSIIETGGQLEQQRLSLSAILGDMEKANTLFGQVKQLALKSPFGVVQIDQMTKQLAAYSFEYEELFDWTKRLADISAATGTSVDRLALALGHVRSEGALSGYTLRQFAMANVPVLRMLSENLGISSKEVRERVRKKEIGADDVQEILKQLTDEGGMFYNAQEVMSQALNAKFKNLRDAFDIMYGEIAEGGVGDALKELANILTQGAKEWERYGKDMLAVGAAVGIGRAAMVLYNTALGENTASTLKSIAAAQQKENAHLRLARAAGIVTKAEYEQLIYNERYSVSGLKVALVENKLTIEELQRAVALGKVNKEVAQAAVVAAGYDAALISNVKVLGFWRRGLFLLGEGFRAATVAVKGFFASVWPLLALTAVFDLVNKTSQSNDAAVEAAEGAAKATNKYQDLQAMTERLGTSQNKTTDQLENNIKAMKEGLIAVGKYTDELKKQVESVETLAEKYDILHAAMKKVSDEANDKQSRKKNLIEEGLSAGGGTAWNPLNWFRDNALQDAKDIDDYTEKLYLALDKNDRVLRDGFKKILETKNLWQKKFESMSAKDVFMSLDESVQNDVLYALRWGNSSTKEMQEAGRSIANALYGGRGALELKNFGQYSYKGAIEELRSHKDELAKAFADAFNVDYPDIDLSKADDTQKVIFAKWLDTTIANLNDVKEAGKKALNDIVIEGTISVRPQYSLDNENWTKFIEDFKEKNPLAYYEWNKHESTGALTEEEKRKSLESYGKTFSGVTQNTLGNAAKKQIKELREERQRLEAFKQSIVYKDSEEARQATAKREKEIDEQINRLKQAQKDYNQYGDPDKNKGGNKEDREAKRLRETIKLYKDAYDWYVKYEKQVGEGAALDKVKTQFQPLFDLFKKEFKKSLSLDSIPTYKENLEEILKEAEAFYNDPKHKNSYMVETIKQIRDAINNVDYEELNRKQENFASKASQQLDELTEKWEIFNSVRQSTGDIDLAEKLSGLKKGATPADIKKLNILEEAGVAIDFDKILSESDDDIEKYVKTLEIPEEKIKGITKLLIDWKKAQKDVTKNDIQNYAKWLGTLVDMQSIRNRNEEEYAETLEEINRLLKQGKITQEQANKRKHAAAVTLDTKNWQTTKMYSDLYNNAIMMANSEFSQAYEREMKSLNDQMKAGTLSAKDYADKVANLNEIAKEFSIDGFLGLKGGIGAFLSGGNEALIQYYNKRAKKARMAQSFYQQVNDKENAKKNEEEAKKYENLSVQLVKMSDGAKKVYSAFQTLGAGIDLVADLFANMGYGDTAETIGDVGSVFGSALSGASSLSMLGPYGMAAGAGIGLISGLFALGDKQLQRQIDALKENVAALEENTQSIKDFRKRTLGYDEGKLRKSIADTYITTIVGAYKEAVAQGHHFIPIMDSSQFAMMNYYATNYGKSGYQAELENLKAQREDYRKMYNLENSKKNVSDEALREYTKQIAELDEQIFYFTEDLANELWGIDFKAWASQISDALWTAFENGESALEAFHDTAKDIISDVAKRMMNIHLIEPVFNKLEERLFGKIGENGVRTGGVYNETTGQFDENETLRILGEFFGEDGEFAKVVESAEDFYKMAERVTGFDLSDDGGSSSSSKSIKGITEQTADLLASYVNSIRANTSVIRELDAKAVQEYWPSQIRLMTVGTQSLANIEKYTAAIMRSNDAIERSNQAILDNFNGLKNKTWSVPMA